MVKLVRGKGRQVSVAEEDNNLLTRNNAQLKEGNDYMDYVMSGRPPLPCLGFNCQGQIRPEPTDNG